MRTTKSGIISASKMSELFSEKLSMIIEDDVALEKALTKIIDKTQSKCPFLRTETDIKLINFTTGKTASDTLHKESMPIICSGSSCKGALMSGQSSLTECRTTEDLIYEAQKFQELYSSSMKDSTNESFYSRMNEIKDEIMRTGTYTLTAEELSFGTKQAWRNASRCIGRIQWNRLELFDCRNVTTTQEMFHALCGHLKFATNGGNIRSAITLFPQRIAGREDFRVWNPQLINFAGYLQPDGSVVGDPGRVQFTRVCQRLGWKGRGGRFDILPWVLSAPSEGAKFYDIPEELVMMVHIEHPKYKWFSEFNIKWYVVPAVADMMLDIGGICFTGAPFNGWYLATEIGARNLCDQQRYNISLKVAEKLGLDTRTPASLWKDTALVETTLAVLFSFQKNEVTIVDHHTAAETFMVHMEREQKLRGGCPADWVWIVPPISGSATPVFHQEMINYNLKPSYEYQQKAWLTYKWPKNDKIKLKYRFRSVAKSVQVCVGMMCKVRAGRIQATILYATETGKSETFAKKLELVLQTSFKTEIHCLDDYDFERISSEQFLVFVVSTFGSGEPPDNGKAFWKMLKKTEEKGIHLKNLKYGVFALGSSQYPNFCQFGKNLDSLLSKMGAERILPVELCDELRGQEHVFNSWLPTFYKTSGKHFGTHVNEELAVTDLHLTRWMMGQFRLVSAKCKSGDIFSELLKLHSKKLFPARILTKMNLQARSSDRKTLLVRLDVQDPSLLSYEPGDHIGIFPTNSPAIVESILKRINAVSVDNTFQVQYLKDEEWTNFTRLPATSLRTLLNQYLDITTPPTCSFLLLLSQMATDNWDKFRLKRLAEVPDDYEDWKSHRHPNLAEVLDQFPSIKLDPTALVSELPLLQPRYYSISSSLLDTPGEVHVTCTLVSYKTQDEKGPIHYGVCTSFLNSFPDQEIPCFIKSVPRFCLPVVQKESIIMVCAGSGIAPFRGFWLERDAQIKKARKSGSPSFFGEMFLFFGCRQSAVDNLYSEDVANLVRRGVLSRVFNAFSKEPGQEKMYVQNKLEVESQLVMKVIESGGHIYVCGDAIMASDVRATIEKILAGSEKVRNIEELLDSGKYHEDVFGVLHKK